MQFLEDFYKQRIEKLTVREKPLKKQDNWFAVVKVAVFFCAFFCLIFFYARDYRLAMGLFGGLTMVFILFAVRHETVLVKLREIRYFREINQAELDMLAHRFSDGAENGSVYGDRDHEYAPDLDLFGPHSLFHFINRAVTAMGRLALANMLKKPVAAPLILERQQVICELAEKTDFRQTLMVRGAGIKDSPAKWLALREMMAAPLFLIPKKAFIVFFQSFTAFTVLVLVFIPFGAPFEAALGMIAVQLAVNGRFKKDVSRIYRETAGNVKILKTYRNLLADIENEPFVSAPARELHNRFRGGRSSASREVERLSVIMDWFDARLSPALHFLVDNLFFFDLQCVLRIEKWKLDNREYLAGWLAALGEFEALASFANLRYNHPAWMMPEIVGEGFVFESRELGHPLIPAARRVANDVEIRPEASLLVITGPNMAGKSTFLRTVGVNIVLAQAGAPVCAAFMKLSPVTLVTSMQTADSLDKQLSLFYAELQRLRLVLNAVRDHSPTFFIIDEMLKGTNALDRLKGALALSRQLAALGGFGVAATHDIGLTDLAAEDPRVRNRHFDGTVDGDRLVFDYKLKEGICTSFNALALMRRMGIDV